MSPDISMCSTKECPLHETCYRFTATPSDFRQSYFAGDPRDVKERRPGEEETECAFYWEIETKT